MGLPTNPLSGTPCTKVSGSMRAFVFHSIACQSVCKWDNDPVAPLLARAAGLLSILLWFGIVAAGCWIAYA